MKSIPSKPTKPGAPTQALGSRTVRTAAKDVRTTSVKKSISKVLWEFPFVKQNYIILAIGTAVILLGYAFMATGLGNGPAVVGGAWANPLAIVWAPILLVIGYCVIIPLGILKYFVHKDDSDTNNPS